MIPALGFLNIQSPNPKVAVFQLSAAAVSFNLTALHFVRSNALADAVSSFLKTWSIIDSVLEEQHPRETLGQRLVRNFPCLIIASCCVLFMLSITFTSPKATVVTTILLVFAVIPMTCGRKLPAALTLAFVFLYCITFLTFIFLVYTLPTEWWE